MDQTSHRAVETTLRWILSGLVIAGVLAMHVLGGHDGVGSAPMAMAPASINSTATETPSMDMSTMATDQRPAATVQIAQLAKFLVPTAVPVDSGNGVSDMSCCVLFLITGAALALMALLGKVRFSASSPGRGRVPTGAVTRRWGPPGAAPPRFSLCVLRV